MKEKTLIHAPAGTMQSSKTSSHVSLPLMPNLSSFGEVENPGKPHSIINAVIPLLPFSGDVLAYTTSVDATGPLVILSRDDQSSTRIKGMLFANQNLVPFKR